MSLSDAIQRVENSLKAGKLDPDRLQLGTLLSSGKLCDVYKGKYQVVDGFGIKVAVKHLTDESMSSATRRFKVYTDQAIALSKKCSTVCPVLGCCTKDGQLCLVMELCEDSLQDMLSRAPGGKLDFGSSLDVLVKITNAISCLHEQSIFHLNLKPGNVLFGEEGQVMLADVGFTPDVLKSFGPRGTSFTEQIKGPVNYMSSEYLSTDPKSIQPDRFAKADSWSIAAIMQQVWSGSMPFEDHSSSKIVELVGNGDNVPAIPNEIPAGAKKLLRKCYKKPSQRPSISKVIKELNILKVDSTQSVIQLSCDDDSDNSGSGIECDKQVQDQAEEPTDNANSFPSLAVLTLVDQLTSASKDVRDQAVAMLSFIAYNGGDDIVVAIKPLLKMLDSEKVSVKLAALITLMNMSSNEGGRQAEIDAAGALPKLLNILRQSTSVELRKRVTQVMTNMASIDDIALKIAGAETIKLLIDLAGSSAADLRESTLECLHNMANKEAAAVKLVKGGVIPVLVRLMGSDVHTDQQCSASVLQGMADDEIVGGVVSVKVAEAGAIPKLLRLLTIPSFKVQESGACALANLCTSREFAKRAMKAGAPLALVRVMQTGAGEVKMHALRAMMKIKVHSGHDFE